MKCLLFTFFAFAAVEMAFADIAPTQYVGSGIVPVNTAGIRMVNAKVDIEWGTPCKLTAVFELDNETSKPIPLQLGFPVEFPTYSSKEMPLDLSIAFDGVAVNPKAIVKIDGSKDVTLPDLTWYGCKHIFPPGKTTVTVKTKLLASLTYDWQYRENLHYCIQTGGRWEGTIGREEVNIKFPGAVSKEQIFHAAPENFTINGDTVQWVFNDIKPKKDEYDVHIQYLRPDVVLKIASVRAELAKDPKNPKLILKLASHLFQLNAGKGTSGFPPEFLTKDEYAALAAKIGNSSKDDLKLFQSRYALNKEGSYEEKESEWTPERKSMLRILSEAGFERPDCKSPQVDEARAMVEHLLKEQPHNADAWNVYLANYWKFSFAAAGNWFGASGFFRDQIKLIAEAHRDCPDDPCITLWYQCSTAWKESDLFGNDGPISNELGEELQKRNLMFPKYFPEINYDYY